MFRFLLKNLCSLLLAWGAAGLKLMSLDVPTAVLQGESVWLNCTLDLESDDLYSVKWYKDDVEFYRHLPMDSPSAYKYDIPGIRLDLHKSVQGHVYLTKTDLDTEGIYRCEASAESPTFQTVEAEKSLKIYVIPQEDPEIVGSQSRYEVGDYVNVTCQSGPSKPAAVLKWYLNGKEIDKGLEVSYPVVVDHTNGLQTSILGLRFLVKPMHLFQGGAITLKCTATVSQTYSTSSEELIIGEKFVGTAPAMDTLAVVTKDGPLITGGQSQYRVGEVLILNCSSTKSRPAPILRWFINEELIVDNSAISYPPTVYSDGQESSTLGLHLRVAPHHLDEKGEVRLKCTATLSRVINFRSEERRVGGNHRNSGLQVAENYGKVSERSSHGPKTDSSRSFLLVTVFILLILL